MKGILILSAALALAGSARAGGIEAGDGVAAISLGAGRISGNDRDLYKTGFLASAEYLRYRSPVLGYGGEVSLHVPESKSKDVAGSANRRNLNGRFLSLLATGRLNLNPSGSHTPYAAVGLGVAQHQVKETLTPIGGGASSETKHDFWRLTGVLRLGWDCLKHERWIAGVEVRYQYLDGLAQNIGAGLRLGWRY